MNIWRQKWAQGEVVVVRYADDTIVGFQYQTDADRFLKNLRERLAKFGLELHPEKTRRFEFGRSGWGDSRCGARLSASVCELSFETSSRSSTGACMIPCLKLGDGSNRSCTDTSTTTRYQET